MTTVAGAHDALPPPTPATLRDAAVAQHKSNGERSALVLVRTSSEPAAVPSLCSSWRSGSRPSGSRNHRGLCDPHNPGLTSVATPARREPRPRALPATGEDACEGDCRRSCSWRIRGSLGFARPRVLPSCWHRYLPPTARAWLRVSGWGARAARTSADVVAPCGVGQTRRRRWSWRRTFGASCDRSSARGQSGSSAGCTSRPLVGLVRRRGALHGSVLRRGRSRRTRRGPQSPRRA